MKKRVLIIGGGTIAVHYAEGLKKSPLLQPIAMCDIHEDCPARSVFPDLTFFKDYKEGIEQGQFDAAVLALPPKMHVDVATYCMQKGLDVYVEKPLADTKESVQRAYDVARGLGRQLTTMFHWQYADEVLFLKEYLKEKKVESVSVYIRDDYACSPRGVIRADRRGLGGAWLDSGINALSYVNEILPLDGAKLLGKEEYATDGQDLYFTRRKFAVNGANLEIVVDWSTPSRQKQSTIVADGEEIFVDHTLQQVKVGEKLIFEKKVADRLTTHYFNAFVSPDLTEKGDEKTSELLHEILFCNQ